MSIAVQEHSYSTRAPADSTHSPLPDIEIRFTPVYAWLTIGFGVIFFILGLFFIFLGRHRNPGLGVFISVLSVSAAIGANYWRKHLHVVARMNSRQLVLRRDGSIDWENIAAIENKEIRASYHGAPTRSEWICIKLKNKPTPKDRWHGFFLKAKRAIIGYDVIVSGNDMACTTEWFIAECKNGWLPSTIRMLCVDCTRNGHGVCTIMSL